MTLAEAGEIFAYWEESPPPHLILQAIARMLGWSPPPAASDNVMETLAAAPPPGLAIKQGGAVDMPLPLDADALRARNRAKAVALARRNAAPSDTLPNTAHRS